MSWTTPETSSGIDWDSVSCVRDDFLDTEATYYILPGQGTEYLFIGFNEYILCRKVRLYMNVYGEEAIPLRMTMSAYIDDDWVVVYSDEEFERGDWYEIDLLGTQRVKEIRLSFTNDNENQVAITVWECDFDQLSVRPLVNGSLASGMPLIGKGWGW